MVNWKFAAFWNEAKRCSKKLCLVLRVLPKRGRKLLFLGRMKVDEEDCKRVEECSRKI
jgi:hypothetical protein